MGQFDLDAAIANKKKMGIEASFEKAQKNLEIEKEMKDLGLSVDEYKEFLEKRDSYQPTLYDVSLALDDFVVGEFFNRLALFSSFILAKIPAYIAGPSSSGKTVLMDAVSNCVMPSKVLKIAQASDKAIYEQKRDIEKCEYLLMPEINKINPLMIEILKDWGEHKESVYRRAGGIANRFEETVLPPRPFVFSKADESAAVEVPAELITRVVQLTVDSSQDQTKKVLDRKAQNIVNPFKIERVDMVQRAMLRYHVSSSPVYDMYINPMGPKLIDTIPTVFTSSRRDFDKYTANIEGISRFYHKERLHATVGDKQVQFIAPQDVAINQMIFGKVLVQSSLHCSDLDKLIIQVIKKEGKVQKSQIQTSLRKCSVNTTGKNISSRLGDLIDIGYVDETKEGSNKFYTVSDFYKEFIIKPDFREIIDFAKHTMTSIDELNPYADEYINKYCEDDTLFVIDPFTGNTVNILEYDFSASIDLDEGDTRMKTLDIIKEPIKKSVSLSDFM